MAPTDLNISTYHFVKHLRQQSAHFARSDANALQTFEIVDLDRSCKSPPFLALQTQRTREMSTTERRERA